MNRDKILEQALTLELRNDAPLTPQCLDAETLAAWEEESLDAAAMQSAEAHLSTCARCQSMLAVLALGTEAVAPGTLAPTPAPVGTKAPLAPSSSPPSAWFSWRWLAPLAAASAAVTLWMVVPQEQQVAVAPPAIPAAAPQESIIPPAKADAPSAPVADAVAAAPPRTAPPVELQKDTRDRAERAQSAPADTQEKLADASSKKESPAALQETITVTLAAEAPPAAQPARPVQPALPAPSAPAVAGLQQSARFTAAPVEVVAPDALRRWRAVATGIEYSTDRGASWVPVRAAGNESITGGTAVSGTICWLIGRSGVVLVTTDGTAFAKVDLPVRVDATSIAATDARSATVTTADGRTFRTDDSGRTWRQNQAQ